jgi:UDP-3-O-[3-hydroxymyristoyl] glucosamine N-acyltransferase
LVAYYNLGDRKIKLINLVLHVIRDRKQIYFWLLMRSTFKHLSLGAFLVSPFRVDGGDGIKIGAGSFFQRGLWLYCGGIDGIPANLSIGRNCVFGYNNHITCVRTVNIGDFVLTANNVYISDNLHGYEDITKPIMQQPIKFKKEVSIGTGSWIGENVSIIGANIGKNSVIGANSVVTRDIPDYCVAVGSPAVIIKQFDFQKKKWCKIGDKFC